jgi:ribonuclease P protein component
LRSKSLIIYCKKNDRCYSRLGISASKKFGNAVKRNQLKRLVREHFRQSDVLDKSFDILVVASTRFIPLKVKIRDKERDQFSKDLKKLFSSIPKENSLKS